MPKGKKAQLASKMRTNRPQLKESKIEKLSKNPFEIKKNKNLHQNIAGRNVKGRTRNLVIAKNKALTQRQTELESQYHHESNKNLFKDRRFGENDASISAEDKLIKRLQAERKKQLKKNRFALADNDDDQLTHEGEELNFEKQWKLAMKDVNDSDDSEDSLDMEKEMNEYYERTKNIPAGEGEFEGESRDKPKTHKEIMMEIINKSKQYKEERQREKAKVDEEINKLDEGIEELQNLLSFRNKFENKSVDDGAYKDYDTVTKSLVSEIKGAASQRKKTEEEELKEEHNRLKKLEEERIKRMQGAYVDADNKIIEGGDDLEENYELDEDEKKDEEEEHSSDELDEEDDENMNKMDIEEEEEEEESDKKGLNILNGDSLYGDNDMISEEEEEEEEENNSEDEDDNNRGDTYELNEDQVMKLLKEKSKQDEINKINEAKQSRMDLLQKELEEKRQRKQRMAAAEKEMPFIIAFPSNVSDMLDCLYRYRGQEYEYIHRVRVSNNIYNSADNKGKLINFYQMVLRCYEYYSMAITIPKEYLSKEDLEIFNSDSISEDSQGYSTTKEDISIYIEGLKQIEKSIEEMSNDKHIIEGIDRIWRQKTQEIRRILLECIKNKSGYPPLSILLDIYLSFSVYPPTDYKHAILTPIVTSLAQLLISCPITTPQSLLLALFSLSISHEYMTISGHYIPEATALLYTIINYIFAGKKDQLHVFINDSLSWIYDDAALPVNDKLDTFIDNKMPIFLLNNSLSPSAPYKMIIQIQVLKCLLSCLSVYQDQGILIEIVFPIYKTLLEYNQTHANDAVRIQLEDQFINVIYNSIQNAVDTRKTFSFKSKIEEAKTFTPNYMENYQPGHSLHPNKEFVQLKLLQKQKKSEEKAVAREIKRDNLYIDMLHNKDIDEMEEEREKKYHEVMGWLEDQERTVNQAVKKGLAKGGGAKLGNNLRK
ncbi:hypothetical protein WA158_003288 [Blastocystis sp. Blastoise]